MEVSVQRQAPAALLPGKNSDTHLRKGRLDHKDGLYNIQNGKKISCPFRDTNLESYITVPSHCADYTILAPVKLRISKARLHKTRVASRHGD